MKEKTDITIVTAFFNIGRGKIENEVSKNLKRGTDIYLSYFSYLAELDNDMIIFTEEKYKEKIQKMRKNKKTKIITFDLNKKFSKIIKKIREIQENSEFRKRINPDEIHNLEYWLPEYVLINNMKSYLIKTAIIKKMIKTELVAWIDFGYIRNREILNNVKKWEYNFDKEKIHFFNIFTKRKLNKKLKKKEDVYNFIFNNDTIIIGGVIVGATSKWNEFYKKLRRAQNDLLIENIVDDDQGVYIKTYFEMDYFLFQRDENLENKKEWEDYDSIYFSWSKKSKVRMLSSVIFSHKNNKVINTLLDMLMIFWENNDSVPNYFILQILYNELIENYYKKEQCQVISDTFPHEMFRVWFDKYSEDKLQEITKKSSIHKLSFKIENSKRKKDGTFFEYFEKMYEIE